VHSTQFHRDPEGVAAPAPLTAATPPAPDTGAKLTEFDIREATRRALEIRLGSSCRVTCAQEILDEVRKWAEEYAARDGNSQRDMYPYLAGALQSALVDVCASLNEAQKRPADFRARLAHMRRMDSLAEKQRRAAQ